MHMLATVTAAVSQGNLRQLFVDDLPNSPDYIVFDRASKHAAAGFPTVLAVNRQKVFELLTQTPRVQREPEWVEDVLLTMGVWTTPLDFLCGLLARYVGPKPDAADAFARFEANMKNYRWCVVKVLTEWINNPLMGKEFFWAPGLRDAVLLFANEMYIQLKVR